MSKFKVGDEIIVHSPSPVVRHYRRQKAVILKVNIEASYPYFCIMLTGDCSGQKMDFSAKEIKKAYYKKYKLEASRLPA